MNNTKFRAYLLDRIKNLFQLDAYYTNELIFEIFEYQYTYNPVYCRFCELTGRSLSNVSSITEVPFLPVELFKSNIIKTGEWQEEIVFASSGTTGGINSRSVHHIRDSTWYKWISNKIWSDSFRAAPEHFEIFGLLPSYLERNDSSLVYMVDSFIQKSTGGFYLDSLEELVSDVEHCLNSGKKTPVILGVSFALLDLAERYQLNWGEAIIMETGGMKGRRKELTRKELHNILKKGFNVEQIYSEYGMTELQSQAYSKGDGVFDFSKTMKILITDATDPLCPLNNGKEGLVNVVDMANLDTCSFVGTRDLGKIIGEKQFTVTGRLDNSDIRGCNLMVSDL